jgi:phosphoribosylformylglycinamidine cyclo-ligase
MLQREAGLEDREMFQTFNMGVGLVLILSRDQVDKSLAILQSHNVQAWGIGEIGIREETGERVTIY